MYKLMIGTINNKNGIIINPGRIFDSLLLLFGAGAGREVGVVDELGLELVGETISGRCLYVGRYGRGCRRNDEPKV